MSTIPCGVFSLHAEQGTARGQGQRTLSDEELRSTNPLVMLLRSLLPWVNAGRQPDYSAEEGGPQAPTNGAPPSAGEQQTGQQQQQPQAEQEGPEQGDRGPAQS